MAIVFYATAWSGGRHPNNTSYIGSGPKVWAQLGERRQLQAEKVTDLFLGLSSLVHIVVIHFGLAIGPADEALALKTANQAGGPGEPAVYSRE